MDDKEKKDEFTKKLADRPWMNKEKVILKQDKIISDICDFFGKKYCSCDCCNKYLMEITRILGNSEITDKEQLAIQEIKLKHCLHAQKKIFSDV